MPELSIRKTIDVEAPIETLWTILTDPRFIPQYMFGCRAETDWKPGSPLLWKGAADGKLYVKGHVVANDAPRHLAYTIFDPNSAIQDIPANYLTMTYNLKPSSGGATTLEIVQGDFSTVEDGERRYRHSLEGDNVVLDGIKKLAEAEARAS